MIERLAFTFRRGRSITALDLSAKSYIRPTRELDADAREPMATDEYYMQLALAEAEKAAALGEVPVGAVIVRDNTVLARAHNLRENEQDATAHAELLAIRQACRATGHWRLEGTTMYVTLEPCAMCAGALVLARVQRLVYGADDPKTGAVVSLMNICNDSRLNHRLEVQGGVGREQSAALLRSFFHELRMKRE